MKFRNDRRIVLTLDAGGTNFVFSAITGNTIIGESYRLPSYGDSLEKSLDSIIKGFHKIKEDLQDEPVAISFAFPGPADYPNGIIGDLVNLPAYKGGVALGPMLSNEFNLPVYINNDGDLFTLGEAIEGFLPTINEKLKSAGSKRQFKNLLGVTLGTGFGAGIVINGNLLIGDNSAAAEIHMLRNKLHPEQNVEESVSIRAIQKYYCESSGISMKDAPSPKEIYEIGLGNIKGNIKAAISSYKKMAEVLGDAIANAVTLIDGLVVIGGGISAASDLFLNPIVDELNSKFNSSSGEPVNRLEFKMFNLEEKKEHDDFLKDEMIKIVIPGTSKEINYNPVKKSGIGLSKIGTSNAISIGAYAFALSQIDGDKID
ncbi:MAG: ROK family protein [Ignavibacteria bacterium]|jgi:glucokinase